MPNLFRCYLILEPLAKKKITCPDFIVVQTFLNCNSSSHNIFLDKLST